MTINDRIKYFRKEIKGINQKEFAKVLGVTQSGVSYMEQKGSTVADSSIKAICSVFDVNEEWLRNGTEPMFANLQPLAWTTLQRPKVLHHWS
ncbi:MAG: helix-turn-helix transcriptional regulator [Enterocloster sp.]